MLMMRCYETACGVVEIDQATRQRMQQDGPDVDLRGGYVLRQASGDMRIQFAVKVSQARLVSWDGQRCCVAYTMGDGVAEMPGEWAIMTEREAQSFAECWERSRGLTLTSAWSRMNEGATDWVGMSRQNARRVEWRRRLAAVMFAFEEWKANHTMGRTSSSDVMLADMIDEVLDAPYGTMLKVLIRMENRGRSSEAWQMMQEHAAWVCLNQFFGSD